MTNHLVELAWSGTAPPRGCSTCRYSSLAFNGGSGATTCAVLGGMIVSVGVNHPVDRPANCPMAPPSGWEVTSAPDAYFVRLRHESTTEAGVTILEVVVTKGQNPLVHTSGYEGSADGVDDDDQWSVGGVPADVVLWAIRAASSPAQAPTGGAIDR